MNGFRMRMFRRKVQFLSLIFFFILFQFENELIALPVPSKEAEVILALREQSSHLIDLWPYPGQIPVEEVVCDWLQTFDVEHGPLGTCNDNIFGNESNIIDL